MSTPRRDESERFLAVTRPVGKGLDTARLIQELGWSALIVNTVYLEPRPESELYNEFSTILAEGPVDYLVFMSREGVDILFRLLQTHSSVLPSMLGNPRIASVGPVTKTALVQWGVQDALVPDNYSSQGIANLLSSTPLATRHVVLVRSSEADDELSESLKRKGAKVSTLPAYSSRMPADYSTVSELIYSLRLGKVDGLLFTSSQSTTNLFRIAEEVSSMNLAELIRGCLIGAIGPFTAKKLLDFGVQPAIQPSQYLIGEALKMMTTILRKRKAARSSSVLASL